MIPRYRHRKNLKSFFSATNAFDEPINTLSTERNKFDDFTKQIELLRTFTRLLQLYEACFTFKGIAEDVTDIIAVSKIFGFVNCASITTSTVHVQK